MRRNTRTMWLITAAAFCAAGSAHAQAAQDPAVAKLEQRVAKDPNSFGALRTLGVKYYEVGRFQDARATLDKARAIKPNDGVAVLYAGLASDTLHDYAAAREAYGKYLDVGRSRRTRSTVNARLVAIARVELRESARQAVANEQRLQGQQSPATTVAVLPFRCSCADTSLLPLERGMADLVVTDLARASSLKVLERDRMQAIADEIRLSQAGQVDAATATRAGKLIAAGRILNGQIVASGGSQMNLAGALVNTNSAQVDGTPTAQGNLDAIFDTERRYVLSVFQEMNVTLTPDEQKAFEERHVPNLKAFLDYSRGLMAEDEGRLDDAIALFESARSQDPGFTAAVQRAQSASAARAGTQVSSATVQRSLTGSEAMAVGAAQQGNAGSRGLELTLNNVIGDVNPTITTTVESRTDVARTATLNTPQTRDPTTDATGSDAPAVRAGLITIIIKRPQE